ncbi:CesT family type III secretion system chaperone, partial [Desulfovibrio sp. OttesenSCG-928-F20]|nr:CesT family type III secretion system chaperone [Desulfovibrio sp. OttesenSCG-928-F20]
MKPEDALAAYAQQYGLSGLAYENGACRLLLDDDLAIDLEIQTADGSVLMQCALGGGDVRNPDLLADLLGANLFYGTASPHITALDRYSGEVMLLRLLPADQTPELLTEAINAFALEVEAWRERFDARGDEA